MAISCGIEARHRRQKEAFRTASECIGPLEHGMHLFAVTRGQFSMVDAILAVLEQTGRARVTVWTWTIAAYEVGMFLQLLADDRIEPGSILVIDHGARDKNRELIERWQAAHGEGSVKICVNHAKIATVENSQWRVLLRGSMNLNANPKFEQLDVTEGLDDFELVRSCENELEVLDIAATGAEVVRASRITMAWESGKLALFDGVKKWAK